jgi:tRNA(fMet)-specific endonuclease VapC
MLDTSVAIHLRDGDEEISQRVNERREPLAFSMITLVELEGGVRGPEADVRRARLEVLLETVTVRPFSRRDAAIYGQIVAALDFSRRKVLDRMIAAQAIHDGATLVTLNASDFRDIPGLELLEW